MNHRKNNAPIDQIINGLFRSSIGDIIGSDFVSSKPAVNIVESKEAFNIHFAAPGFTKDQFKMELLQDRLHVSAAVKQDEANVAATDEQKRWTRREFDFGTFKRSFKLPSSVQRDNISASYDKGILNITLTKSALENSAKSITIN